MRLRAQFWMLCTPCSRTLHNYILTFICACVFHLSSYWLRTLATVLNVRLEVPTQGGEFGAARGAARLACIGMRVGVVDAVADTKTLQDVLLKPQDTRSILPDAVLQKRYEIGYQAYVASFAHLKALQR